MAAEQRLEQHSATHDRGPTKKIYGVLAYTIAILVPPLAVFLVTGCTLELLINLSFTLLGWIPGVLHAFFVIPRYKQCRFIGGGKEGEEEKSIPKSKTKTNQTKCPATSELFAKLRKYSTKKEDVEAAGKATGTGDEERRNRSRIVLSPAPAMPPVPRAFDGTFTDSDTDDLASEARGAYPSSESQELPR